MLRERGQRVARILHLLEADHPAVLAFALPASPHVEAQRHVAELRQHLGRTLRAARILVAAEAVQDEERRPPFALGEIVRHVRDAGKLQSRGWKIEFLFAHGPAS